ncbi:MAG: hypothetical protein M0T71_11685 [Actinomycetota bacterium]|nr:hypothetical protein [Actinomycetota bacterium]
MILVLAGLVALVLLHLVLATFVGAWSFWLVLLGAGLVGRRLRHKDEA